MSVEVFTPICGVLKVSVANACPNVWGWVEFGIMYIFLRYVMKGFICLGAFLVNSSLKNSETSSGGMHGMPNSDLRNRAIAPFLELYCFWNPISLNFFCHACAKWNLQPRTKLFGNTCLKASMAEFSKS